MSIMQKSNPVTRGHHPYKRGIKVIMKNLKKSPQCPHGPMLLFQRYKNTLETIEEFYACSACRDRKDCNFFLKVGEKLSNSALINLEEQRKAIVPDTSFLTLRKEWINTTRTEPHLRYFCHSCSRFVLGSMVTVKHSDHQVEGNITDDQLSHPTKLLHPLQNTSKEAQFFFSNKTVKFLESALTSLEASTVICIGTPSLLEQVGGNSSLDIMLLDMDWRYGMFFGSHFCWYNMFNHHFMSSNNDLKGEKSRKRFSKFLQNTSKSGSYIIVMDPPFGGRVEALAHTVKTIASEIRQFGRTQNIYYFWIYPYFMEPYIKADLPETKMLDYKIDYTNHPEYRIGSKLSKTHGSPVRVFTNAPCGSIPLPKEEGYKLCDICQHFVSQENKHCFKCNACTSKNGKTYVHCNVCKRCVKPTWKHCNLCHRCCLPSHKCLIIKRKKKN